MTKTNTVIKTNTMTKTRESFRILANEIMENNNTRITGRNNNDLVIGASGAGKTRYYVKPNIMQCNDSFIVVDTKNNLYREMKPLLEANGYNVLLVDFTDMKHSPYGYSIFDFIHRNEYGGIREQDIMAISAILVPIENDKDPFWDYITRVAIEMMIGYVMEALPEDEVTIESLLTLQSYFGTDLFSRLMESYKLGHPDGFTAKKWQLLENSQKADKMISSINGIAGEKLSVFCFDGYEYMSEHENRIDFCQIANEKTAVFLNISDTERSMDKLVNIFYAQALKELCACADKSPNNRLKVPVRLIMDDFAANAVIPDFDKIISVIRSREIYVSLILQSISQLESMYGKSKAQTIINNCDNCLYLGGQDVETSQMMGIRANKTVNSILDMPLDDAYLFTRGMQPRKVRKYDIKEHPNYRMLPEAWAKKGCVDRERGDADVGVRDKAV